MKDYRDRLRDMTSAVDYYDLPSAGRGNQAGEYADAPAHIYSTAPATTARNQSGKAHRWVMGAAAVLMLSAGVAVGGGALQTGNGSAAPKTAPSTEMTSAKAPQGALVTAEAPGGTGDSGTSTDSDATPSLAELAQRAAETTLPGTGEVSYSQQYRYDSSMPGPDMYAQTSERWNSADNWILAVDTPADGSDPYSNHYPLDEYYLGCIDGSFESDPGDFTPAAATMWDMTRCVVEYPPLSPQATGQFLTELSELDGVNEKGLVTDWLGRPGVAFSTYVNVSFGEDGTDELEIVLDPDTGRLLAWSLTMIENSVGVEAPWVQNYVAVVQESMVEKEGQRP